MTPAPAPGKRLPEVSRPPNALKGLRRRRAHAPPDDRQGDRHIERLAFNTAIVAMMELVNVATASGGPTRDQLHCFVLLVSPFAPHFAEELWSRLGHAESLAYEPWPAFDEQVLVYDEIEPPVQIGGKVRARITVSADATPERVE